MGNRMVRITDIFIQNFKNIGNGKISLENKHKEYRASILGLYGQNGSGKTALIDAIALLKYALSGRQVPVKYADYIKVDMKFARFIFQFQIFDDEGVFQVWYEFSLGKVHDVMQDNMEGVQKTGKIKAEIYDEVLSYSVKSKDDKVRKGPLIDTRTKDVFIPKVKYQELLGDEVKTEILVTKKFVRTTSRSFIFSNEMISLFRKHCKNKKYLALIDELVIFGNRELLVINTDNSGLISLNALPISFKYKGEKGEETFGNLMLPLNAPVVVPMEAHALVIRLVENMNIVLDKIIPGLTIGVLHLSDVVSKEGLPSKMIQLMSIRNGNPVSFQYESEGIKKIVSILQLLIAVYNNSSVTVAIDELDAGIFEYLLGELLQIISEKGKGQLIFTSHNLRPLETIDKGFIAFTTTNSEKRYIRMMNVKGNNNLRDFYYRDIVLGEQSEQVYDSTNNYEIALAFREAGDSFDS